MNAVLYNFGAIFLSATGKFTTGLRAVAKRGGGYTKEVHMLRGNIIKKSVCYFMTFGVAQLFRQT